MKCPLLIIANCTLPTIENTTDVECQGEECAWWHVYQDDDETTHTACAVIHIADVLSKKAS